MTCSEKIATGMVLDYIDDILIFGKDQTEHQQQVHRVLEILQKNRLFLKLEKCKFEMSEMEYLGLIMSEGEVRMDA